MIESSNATIEMRKVTLRGIVPRLRGTWEMRSRQ